MPTVDSYEEMMDNMKADHILNLFIKHVSPVPNWNPELFQKKFLYTDRSKVWVAKQQEIKLTSDFKRQQTFQREIRGGYNFIACVQTGNLEAVSEENRGRLAEFFDEFNDGFVWVLCRGYVVRNRTLPSDRFVEIVDLCFGPRKDRNNPLQVLCPIFDLLVTVSIETKNNVSILANDSYFEIKRKGKKNFLKIKKSSQSFFKAITPTDTPRFQPQSVQDSRTNAENSRIETEASHLDDQPTSSQFNTQPSQSHSDSSCIHNTNTENTIEFHGSHLIVKTKNRSQRFDIQNSNDHSDLFTATWAEETKDGRDVQWTELSSRRFNLFEKVKNSKADGLIFIPASEMLTKNQKNDIIDNLKTVTGIEKVPDEIAYVIFDRHEAVTFTSK